MNADHRHELEANDLREGLNTFAAKAKSGEFLTTRLYVIVGSVVLVVAAVAYWMYASGESRKHAAQTWTELDSLTAPGLYAEFAKKHPDDVAGRVARLQEARIWLGPDGISKLSSRNPDDRKKAIESVEKARDLLPKLADEFKDDLTLQVQCLDAATNAELALVGIPKTPGGTDYRGSVPAAVGFLDKIVKIVGETNPVGEAAKSRAADLTAKAQEVLQVGIAIHTRLTPEANFGPEIKFPQGPFEAPKPPTITPPAPPAIVPPLPPPGVTPPPATTPAPPTPAPPPATKK